jgi:hypothetical protein
VLRSEHSNPSPALRCAQRGDLSLWERWVNASGKRFKRAEFGKLAARSQSQICEESFAMSAFAGEAEIFARPKAYRLGPSRRNGNLRSYVGSWR